MMTLVQRFIRDERGEDLIEYGLLAAFVASVFLAVLASPLKPAISDAFDRAITILTSNF